METPSPCEGTARCKFLSVGVWSFISITPINLSRFFTVTVQGRLSRSRVSIRLLDRSGIRADFFLPSSQ